MENRTMDSKKRSDIAARKDRSSSRILQAEPQADFLGLRRSF